MTSPPQLSPDGHWWWTGSEWVPAASAPVPAPAPGGFAPMAEAPAVPVWQQQPPQQPLPPGYGYGYYPVGPPAQNDALAITSLAASLIWAAGVGSVVGVVTGHLSRSRARREGRPASGLATAGLVLGYVGLVGTVGFVVLLIAGIGMARTVVSDLLPRSELQDAAYVEDNYYAQNHTYLDDTELHQDGADRYIADDLEVVRVGETSYCLRAGSGSHTWYWHSEQHHATRTPC